MRAILSVPTSFCTEYQQVYNAMTNSKPKAIYASRQNTLVKTLVDASLWTGKFDVFYVFANNASDNALINWINPGTYDCIKVGDPSSFVAYEGYAGNAANAYLNWNWNPSENGVNYILNSAALGVYIRNNVNEAGRPIGCYDGATAAAFSPREDGNAIFYLNDLNGNSYSTSDSRGMWIITRPSSSIKNLYYNKDKISGTSVNSTMIPDVSMFTLQYNVSGAPSSSVHSTYQVSMDFAGGSLTDDDVSTLTNAFEVYMDSNGKGVI